MKKLLPVKVILECMQLALKGTIRKYNGEIVKVSLRDGQSLCIDSSFGVGLAATMRIKVDGKELFVTVRGFGDKYSHSLTHYGILLVSGIPNINFNINSVNGWLGLIKRVDAYFSVGKNDFKGDTINTQVMGRLNRNPQLSGYIVITSSVKEGGYARAKPTALGGELRPPGGWPRKLQNAPRITDIKITSGKHNHGTIRNPIKSKA